MKHKHTALMATLPFALLLALAGCSHGTNGQPGVPRQNGTAQPTPNTTAAQPMQNSQNTPTGQNAPMNQNAPTNQNALGNATGGSGGMGQSFSALAGSKGYISREDAARDPWLAKHFKECDANHDGKISQSEYQACRMQQQQRGPQAGSTS